MLKLLTSEGNKYYWSSCNSFWRSLTEGEVRKLWTQLPVLKVNPQIDLENIIPYLDYREPLISGARALCPCFQCYLPRPQALLVKPN